SCHKHRAANARDPSDHEQNAKSIVVEIALDLLAPVRRHHASQPAMFQQSRSPKAADTVKQYIADENAGEAHGENQPAQHAKFGITGNPDAGANHRNLFRDRGSDPGRYQRYEGNQHRPKESGKIRHSTTPATSPFCLRWLISSRALWISGGERG